MRSLALGLIVLFLLASPAWARAGDNDDPNATHQYAWVFILAITVFLLLLFCLVCCSRAIDEADQGDAAYSALTNDNSDLIDEETLGTLTEYARQSYERARAWQESHPPNSVPTDITFSQLMSIQEKGVSAWEFVPDITSNIHVFDRTEISFYDGDCSVQTNLPLPRNQEVYYWEAKMYELSPATTVAVGVATKPYPNWRLPGWNRHSVGYFSNTGNKHINQPVHGQKCGQPLYEGDVIGVGYRHRTGTIFLTRNGRKLEDACHNLRMNLFPTIGANGPCQIHVNFGQAGFVFIEANVKKWGLAPMQGTLAPPPAYGHERETMLLEAGTPIRHGGDTSSTSESESRRHPNQHGQSLEHRITIPSDRQRSEISLADLPPPSYATLLDDADDEASDEHPEDPSETSRLLDQSRSHTSYRGAT